LQALLREQAELKALLEVEPSPDEASRKRSLRG